MVAAMMPLKTRKVSQRYSFETAPEANAGVACRAAKINNTLFTIRGKILLITEITNFVIMAKASIQASNVLSFLVITFKIGLKFIIKSDIIALNIITA